MDWRAKLREDFERFANGLPRPLEGYILETYGISLASEYAGIPIKNPFGKASGQLSLNENQVERDAEAGLGFVVLKTLIAQDESGSQSMKAWAIQATKMTVEEIVGTREAVRGERGWTISWKGRGWSESFEKYLDFFDRALQIGWNAKMLIVPSVKYHLPKPGEDEWRTGEYEFTTSEAAPALATTPKGSDATRKGFFADTRRRSGFFAREGEYPQLASPCAANCSKNERRERCSSRPQDF